jgi:predicted nucleotidyltransferase
MIMDEQTRDALLSFKSRLIQRYGKHLKAVYLFGSRARGNHRPDSDADVAVFLDWVPDPLAEQLDLIDEGYSILLAEGINIQPWIFEAASLKAPGSYRAAHLLQTVLQEGVAL